MDKARILSLLCLATMSCVSGCEESDRVNSSYTSNKLNNYRTREPVRAFILTFQDAPNARGSGEVFTTAFKNALQTASLKTGTPYITLSQNIGADVAISGRVTLWKKGGWTEMASVGFIAECVSTKTHEVLWSVSSTGSPFKMSLPERTPEFCAEQVALDGINKIRKMLIASHGRIAKEKTTLARAKVNRPITTTKRQKPNLLKRFDHLGKIERKRQSTIATYPAMGQQWAVVVGLSEYANSGQNGLSNLVYADDDAKAFANSLKQQGWSSSHIKLLTNRNASKRNVEIALESWLTKAGPDDMITLFWSGHGFPDPADPEKVYFACYDTDIRIPATGYRMDKVRSAVEELGVRNVVMLADTCHAGKLITRSNDKAIGITPYVNSLVKKKNVPKGWIFMVASDVDRKAIEDSSWSHGAFTHCLLKALNGAADGYQSAGVHDGTVTMGELRAFMNSAMPDETQRILGVAKRPIITTSTGDPGIWGLSLTAK